MPKKTKKPRRPIGSYFSNNLLLKVLSLVFAVVLWSFVIAQTNPVRTKTLTEIPVQITGLDELKKSGYTVRDVDAANALRVTVRLNVSHSHYRYVDNNTVSATVDLSQITAEGAASLPVLVTLMNVGDVSLASVTPSSVNVAIDTLEEKEVPLQIETTGVLPDGLISLSPSCPESVRISGASYYVGKIAGAVLDVDLSSLTDGSVVTSLCRFTDEKNNVIKFDGVRVTADMDVLTIKEVDVSAEASVTGAPAEGYQLERVTAGKVRICGHKNVIEDVSSVAPDAIDLTDASVSFDAPLTFSDLPEGVYLVPGQDEISAQVEITEAQQTLTLSLPVKVSGLSGKTARISDGTTTVKVQQNGETALRVKVTVSGSRSLLSSVTDDDVIVLLALDHYAAGTYNVEPSVALSTRLASSLTAKIASPEKIAVTIE